MTKRAVCFAWMLLVPFCLLAQDLSAAKFEKFTSKEGNYTILFPGKVETQKQTASTPAGDIVITMNVVALGDKMAFIVGFNDYPDALKNADKNQMLEGVRNGNKGNDGTIVEDEVAPFGPEKLPGRKVLIQKPKGMFMKNLMFMKGTRLYQIMFVGTEDSVKSKEVEKYFKSFELTN